ncbi:MAG: hypothetical protein ACU0AY_01005 [Marinibacterium profundimaris]
MGDRALVLFKDHSSVSPTVYLHWHGSAVPELVEELDNVMAGRRNDAAYAAARFIGIVHERIPGNLSLGVMQTPEEICAAVQEADPEIIASYTLGDARVVVVDTTDFSWKDFTDNSDDI